MVELGKDENTRIVNTVDDLDRWEKEIFAERERKKEQAKKELAIELKHNTGILITGIIYLLVLVFAKFECGIPTSTIGDYVVYQHIISAILNIAIITSTDTRMSEKIKDSFVLMFLIGPGSVYVTIYLLYILIKKGLKKLWKY